MSFLNGIRLLADLALYYAFAGYFSACFGAPVPWLCLLLPAVCFGLSALLARSKALRVAVLFPVLLGFLLPGAAARVAYGPAAGYTVYLALAGDYQLSSYQHLDRFLLFVKVYPAFALLFGLWNAQAMLGGSLPVALLAAAANVYLLRVLRCDPDMGLRPQYMALSAGPLVLVAGAAWLLQWEPAAKVILAALRQGYSLLVYPVLDGIAWLWIWLLEHGLLPVVEFIAWVLYEYVWRVMGRNEAELQVLMDLRGRLGLASENSLYEASGESSLWVGIIGSAAALAGLTAVVCLFRFLARRTTEEPLPADGPTWNAGSGQGDAATQPPARGAANQVRRIYRRYLRGCVRGGRKLHPWYTSRDMLGSVPPSARPAEEELRLLYLRARYQGSASAAEAARARELWQGIRRAQKDESAHRENEV